MGWRKGERWFGRVGEWFGGGREGCVLEPGREGWFSEEGSDLETGGAVWRGAVGKFWRREGSSCIVIVAGEGAGDVRCSWEWGWGVFLGGGMGVWCDCYSWLFGEEGLLRVQWDLGVGDDLMVYSGGFDGGVWFCGWTDGDICSYVEGRRGGGWGGGLR